MRSKFLAARANLRQDTSNLCRLLNPVYTLEGLVTFHVFDTGMIVYCRPDYSTKVNILHTKISLQKKKLMSFLLGGKESAGPTTSKKRF